MNSKLLSRLGMVVATSVLASCSYQIDKVENPVSLPSAWDAAPVVIGTAVATDASAGTPIPLSWWQSFDSIVLTQLIAEALAGNPTLIVAEERLQQAERALEVSRNNLLPDLSVNAGSSRTRSGGSDQPTSTRESTVVSGQLRYDVDMWGGNAAAFRASRASLLGTRYDLDAARLTLSANVATQYFQLLSIRARVAIARDNLAIAERLLRIVDARYQNGVALPLDLTQQTTAVLQQRTNLIPLETQQRQTETALGLLLGRVPQDFHVEGEAFEQITVPTVAAWQPGELLLRRPDLAAAETDLAGAKANIAVARANLLPGSISFTAGGTTASSQLLQLSNAVDTFSISGALSVVESVFGFRSRQLALENARSNERITLQNYANTIRSSLKQVDDGLANAEANLRREDAQRATLDQARRALKLAELQYREGNGNLQSVLEAQRTQFSAQDALAQIRLSRLNSALDLYVALGGGWQAPEARN